MQICTPTYVGGVRVVVMSLQGCLRDWKGLSKKKQDHHGEAICRIPWHGYVIFSRLLAATSSRWTGRARCRRILLNYLNRLRKKLISTLICFISFFNLLPTRSPRNRCDRAPLTYPSGCASFMIPPPSGMHVFGWLLCKIVVRRPPKTSI